jgi:two-component system LytT family response regulator
MMEKNITAIIIDDEQSARKILRNILESFCPHVKILGEANSIANGKDLIHEFNPQVIFLDVEMPGGTGFDLIKEAGPLQSEIIFTTAHNHYAINAIRSFALDYLLKPINPEELVEAVSKIKSRDANMTSQLIQLLSQQLTSKKEYADQLAIPSANGLEIIKVEDVMYCEGDGNYTTFYLTPDQKHISSKTLKEYERILPAQQFVRAHQKYLVNVKFVKRYLKGRGGTLVMTNGKSIDVAHSKRAQVIEALG